MKALRRLWAGELPLSEAFWSWAVIGGIALNIMTSLGFVLLIVADEPVAAWVAGYAIPIPYNVAAAVGVWRSAAREPGNPLRANIYRAVALVGMAVLCAV